MTPNERLLIGAIRAAQDELASALQSDLEHGVRRLNERASADFKANYPALNQWIGRFMGTADVRYNQQRGNA